RDPALGDLRPARLSPDRPGADQVLEDRDAHRPQRHGPEGAGEDPGDPGPPAPDCGCHGQPLAAQELQLRGRVHARVRDGVRAYRTLTRAAARLAASGKVTPPAAAASALPPDLLAFDAGRLGSQVLHVLAQSAEYTGSRRGRHPRS